MTSDVYRDAYARLAALVELIELRLKILGWGVPGSVPLWEDEPDKQLCYIKVSKTWGLYVEDAETKERTPLHRASRRARIQAMFRLDALLAALQSNREDAFREILTAIQKGEEFAERVNVMVEAEED